MTSLLARLIQKRRKPAEHLTFTVYTRQECCCCHRALDLLKGSRRKHGFRIDEVDVDTDPALAAAHGQSVPVVAVGGKVRFKGVVNPVLLERLLEAEGIKRADSNRSGGETANSSRETSDLRISTLQ
jgi:glutaredoxin